MPLKLGRIPEGQRQQDGARSGLHEPLLPAAVGQQAAAAPVAAAGRSASFLPTPFLDAALQPPDSGGSGTPPGLLPAKKAGGVLRDKHGRFPRQLTSSPSPAAAIPLLVGSLPSHPSLPSNLPSRPPGRYRTLYDQRART